jgi:tRNA U54 and U55 pseudouridine synthase Pus10
MAIFKPGVRDKIEKHILKRMKEFDTSGYNHGIYKDALEKMSDEEFNKMISDEDGIPLYSELGGKFLDDTKHQRDYLAKMGIPVSQHVNMTDPKTGMVVRSLYKHMRLRLPVRNQTQTYEKKSSIPKHNRAIDQYTHQVTGSGVSKASSISYPETYLMVTEGYEKSSEEMVNVRGGNQALQRAVHAEILATGRGSIDQPLVYSISKAPKVLGHIYRAMHIGSNLGKAK